ncbi:hypothetical protein C5167_018202 [Papaver somniferum]|uniref:Aminotransferase class I/classII large domain-containing protein n=1 Tax=Papaver somniferum TaxID=3469 RepID=A0A4Y7IPY5_PAPSO|nr:probable aminotransferase TAT2 [Papaver somniferum]RZC49781.1 hypothetical protein C5167_018202 [Papaver somniferum]
MGSLNNVSAGKEFVRRNEKLKASTDLSISGTLDIIRSNLNVKDQRPTIPLGHGDPSPFACFRTTHVADDALNIAVKTGKFNSYAPVGGILPARRSVAEYLSRDFPYTLSADDVFLTSGCRQAIEVIISVLSYPGANILIPKPGYPHYDACAAANNLEIRHFDLLPEKAWEIDLEAVEALADENTLAIAVINPGNPCGNVYSYEHLKKVAETAKRLGIPVIADEVYGHLTFGSNPFVPMGVFGSMVPVFTLGSISKRWLVPGWRLGWIVITDPNGFLKEAEIPSSIKQYLNMSNNPASIIQAAVPHILENTKEEFFENTISLLREALDICADEIKEITCISLLHKPQGSMFVMVKLNTLLLKDISDDLDFCNKLAKEESVIILPGIVLGVKNWLRITFSIDLPSLKDALSRIKSFCQRHAKPQNLKLDQRRTATGYLPGSNLQSLEFHEAVDVESKVKTFES